MRSLISNLGNPLAASPGKRPCCREGLGNTQDCQTVLQGWAWNRGSVLVS